ncbi:isoaspartyl peptidase/L-asparaginase, partial [Arthrospira platensis SPKY1]|nr:isoaspartyl peptidase/L-asparaginase [Arthrospira platensis SPKY1]
MPKILMIHPILLFRSIALLLLFCCVSHLHAQSTAKPDYVLVIHGGAGAMQRSAMTDEQAAAYDADLNRALYAGEAILAAGGTSLDAIVASIQILESSPWFNAGVGAVLTHNGEAELDAS